MPLATLPTRVKLYYTDSGKPSEPEYDTIVIVHGVAYNAGTLLPVLSDGIDISTLLSTQCRPTQQPSNNSIQSTWISWINTFEKRRTQFDFPSGNVSGRIYHRTRRFPQFHRLQARSPPKTNRLGMVKRDKPSHRSGQSNVPPPRISPERSLEGVCYDHV